VTLILNNYTNKLNSLQALSNKINGEMRALYMDNIFLTWRWWLCAAMTILPWVLWIIFRKKGSTSRLLFSGFVVIILSMLLDDIGVELNFWDYHVDIDAINPSFILWDMSVLPVVTMTFLQYKTNINPLIKALVFAGLASFVVEPFFAWMNFYDPEKWKHLYSFPVFIIIYLLAHFCSLRKSFGNL